jgi:hypothetical protein
VDETSNDLCIDGRGLTNGNLWQWSSFLQIGEI